MKTSFALPSVRWRAFLAAAAVGLGSALTLTPAVPAAAVSGAAFTTVNEGVDGTGHCLNGNPSINCNIYDSKDAVWLNGGPSVAYVGDGTYFFAVLSPGGQSDPNDGSANNLSSSHDAYTARTFTVTAGVVGYTPGHDFDSNKIRLMPYDDTTNPGGVYILAICSLGADGATYPVKASDCKYDMFKVVAGSACDPNTDPTCNPGGNPAADLTVAKDANGSYNDTFTWGIQKSVDKTLVQQLGGTATFNYTVTVTHDSGTVGDVAVSGTIQVFNPNVDAGSNTLPVSGVDVIDILSDGTSCDVTNGTDQTLTSFETDFAYTCSLSSLPQGELDNTATATWPQQQLSNGDDLAAGSADFTFSNISFDGTNVDDCVTVTDTIGGSLGSLCSTDATPSTFKYSNTVNVPGNGVCTKVDNTATYTTNTNGATGSDSKTVYACGVGGAGGLTMGFWQNKNGQTIIKNYSGTNCQSLRTWLNTFHPFSDLAATSCGNLGATSNTTVVGWVYNVIKAATCTSTSKTCNAMLKAQMLATALDVYFSDGTLGGNRIGAPNPIGGDRIDLTKICNMIDGSGGGSCSGTRYDVSAQFGGTACQTVLAMLTYQNTSDPAVDAGANWYGQVKTPQVNAKNAFDSINNQVAYSCP